MKPKNVILPLNDGGRVELINMLTTELLKTSSEEDICRNIFRFNAKGNMIWQVAYNPFDVSTFTNIYFDAEGILCGYNFDGGEYLIDLDSGIATPNRLLK